MLPIRLQLENFCCHSNSDISFADFSSALIVGKIKGNDKFSNGAGKSTIFNAIKYALFNETDFSQLDKIIRYTTDNCRVVFDFISNNETYRITRSRSKKAGSDVRLFRFSNNGWEDITQRRNNDTEKEIAKIIKINSKTFSNSVLFAQNDISGLASLTPGPRKAALKEALQLNVYSKYEAAAKKRATDLQTEIDKEKIVLSTIGTPKYDIEIFQKMIEGVDMSISSSHNKLIISKNNYDIENSNYTALTKKFETLERQSNEYLSKQKSIQQEVKKIQETTSEFSKKIYVVEDTGKTLSKELKSISESLAIINTIVLRDIITIKLEAEDLSQELINKKSKYNSLISDLEELKIPLPEGSICKYCRQTLKDKDVCQKEIDNEIKNKENILKKSAEELKLLTEQYKKLNNEIKYTEETNTKEISLKALSIAKSKEITDKRTIYSEYSHLLNNYKNSLNEKNKELELISKSQDNTEEHSKLKINLSNSRSTLEALQNQINTISENITKYSNDKAVLNHKLEARTKDNDKLKVCQSNISQLEDKYLLHQRVITAFGSKGIPALITHTILDDFQVETNYWLSRIRPGLQLQFSVVKDREDGDREDTLDILYMLNGFDMEHAQLSGAQKFIVALALKLGLSTVIKKRLGIEIKLLLIDEVDKSIDAGTLEVFADIIRELQKDFKVLVITHNDELKTKFSNAILVEQDEKFVSTAKVVDRW